MNFLSTHMEIIAQLTVLDGLQNQKDKKNEKVNRPKIYKCIFKTTE